MPRICLLILLFNFVLSGCGGGSSESSSHFSASTIDAFVSTDSIDFEFDIFDNFENPNNRISSSRWSFEGITNNVLDVKNNGGVALAKATKNGSDRVNSGIWVLPDISLQEYQAFSADFEFVQTESKGNVEHRGQIILGYILNETETIDIGISLKESGAVSYYMEILNNSGSSQTISGDTFANVDAFEPHTLIVGWNGERFIFQVDDTSTSVSMTSKTNISIENNWDFAAIRASSRNGGKGSFILHMDNVRLGHANL